MYDCGSTRALAFDYDDARPSHCAGQCDRSGDLFASWRDVEQRRPNLLMRQAHQGGRNFNLLVAVVRESLGRSDGLLEGCLFVPDTTSAVSGLPGSSGILVHQSAFSDCTAEIAALLLHCNITIGATQHTGHAGGDALSRSHFSQRRSLKSSPRIRTRRGAKSRSRGRAVPTPRPARWPRPGSARRDWRPIRRADRSALRYARRSPAAT